MHDEWNPSWSLMSDGLLILLLSLCQDYYLHLDWMMNQRRQRKFYSAVKIRKNLFHHYSFGCSLSYLSQDYLMRMRMLYHLNRRVSRYHQQFNHLRIYSVRCLFLISRFEETERRFPKKVRMSQTYITSREKEIVMRFQNWKTVKLKQTSDTEEKERKKKITKEIKGRHIRK